MEFFKKNSIYCLILISFYFLLGVIYIFYLKEKMTIRYESQIEISKLIRFRQKEFQRPVERFMKRYYIAAKNIGSLTESFFQ